MYIPETFLHCLQLCASVSCHVIFQLPAVETLILDMSEVWYNLNRSSLAQCQWSSWCSSRPCSQQVKARVAWVLDGMIEYCMDISFISSVHVRFGNCVFNILAVKSADPVNLEKAMHIAVWLDICTAFSIASIQASNLLLLHQMFLLKLTLPVLLFIVSWQMIASCPQKLFTGILCSLWIISSSNRHVKDAHMGKCYKTNYLTWLTLYSENLNDHGLYVMIQMVLCDSYVFYFAITGTWFVEWPFPP